MGNRMVEANIDALVGPTHHYSGLGVGNVASMEHRHSASSPKQAALEGLNKAWMVAQSGVPQFLLPPPKRPRLDQLASYGFQGSLPHQLRSASSEDWTLVSAVYSSSFMWAANAATITPACDSHDGRVHVTIANLNSSLHRAIEADERYRHFVQFFSGMGDGVVVHPALPAVVPLRDEGAANHMRLCRPNSPAGINIFVHGDSAGGDANPSRFMSRHTLAASKTIQRLHRLDPRNTFHLQQHPAAISAGVFHNDVIATSHQNLLIHHERAFSELSNDAIRLLEETFRVVADLPLIRLLVTQADLSMKDAVRSYLFNSQLICPAHDRSDRLLAPTTTRSDHGRPRMLLLAPQQCREVPSAENLINGWVSNPDVPIDQVMYADLRQSMAGGGGPACLRLRLPIQEELLATLHSPCRLDESLYHRLLDAIDSHYPERLSIQDLSDWALVEQSWTSAEIMARILGFEP